jgi:hypothetical protein
MRVDVGRGQPLHVVELGELAAVVRRRVGHELLMRLLAEVARVDQEQDALGAAELEQAVHRGDGGEGLAGAGGHVHQRARLVLRQRLFQPGDGADLAIAQIALGQRGHLLGQAATQGVGLRQPFGASVSGLKKWKIRASAAPGRVVGEADDLAGGFEQEAQRRVVLAPFERGVA